MMKPNKVQCKQKLHFEWFENLKQASKSDFPCALYFVQLFADDLVLFHVILHSWLKIGKRICEGAMCEIINKSYY